MIAKTEAIALRNVPFSRTSRVVTWLTRDFGRIVTVIKGACRPKSFFLGQIDLAYRCEILFYHRESNGIHNIREAWPIDCRDEFLRSDWRAAVAADYLCWLTAQTTEPMLDSNTLFEKLDEALGDLSLGKSPCETIFRYEFQLLDALGLAPNFSFCKDCILTENRRRFCRFLIDSGHLSCVHSLSHQLAESSVALSKALLQALEKVQLDSRGGTNAEGPSSFHLLDCSPELVTGVRRFLGLFLCHHLDISMLARRTAFSWLDIGDPAAGIRQRQGQTIKAAASAGAIASLREKTTEGPHDI